MPTWPGLSLYSILYLPHTLIHTHTYLFTLGAMWYWKHCHLPHFSCINICKNHTLSKSKLMGKLSSEIELSFYIFFLLSFTLSHISNVNENFFKETNGKETFAMILLLFLFLFLFSVVCVCVKQHINCTIYYLSSNTRLNFNLD